jgi:hypothetical protein
VIPVDRKPVSTESLRGEVRKTRLSVKVQLLAAQAEISEFYEPALTELDSITGLLDVGTAAGTAEAERRFRSFRSR